MTVWLSYRPRCAVVRGVTCRVLACGSTMPLGQMRIHIAFHLDTKDHGPHAAVVVGTLPACFACISQRVGTCKSSQHVTLQ